METIDRILELIKQKKITEYRVMKDCSLQTNTFTYWKNGRSTPNIDTLIKLANYFNVSIDYLVGRIDNDIINIFLELNKQQQEKVFNFINNMKI